MLESTELLVAGRGPADLHRSDAVRFLGPVSDLPALFSAADILVAPTWYDPFSNACLEALSAGLPVITTPANGFSEFLTPGLHGDIVPVGDSLSLAEAIEAWQKPGRAEAAREACRRRASEFSIEKNARATLEILRSTARP
jgi:UDP-glucose:(heptosyl)LPS alpha-1,3-glucosyltransferase